MLGFVNGEKKNHLIKYDMATQLVKPVDSNLQLPGSRTCNQQQNKGQKGSWKQLNILYTIIRFVIIIDEFLASMG